ncbi:MAG: dTDP-4-dehydrorhamnose 3,5-epimerase [Armatimonadetes bacterium]|nr:dTDP-4-dehydrorhamnose 3,5-epimerase [Armatimonadota bacterium]MDE2207567.1 dTDP-4-dehydrorhamnose 3,5-epimerase [Armatimonadota bacterium]
MNVTATDLPGVLIIEPDVYYDERGFFLESWRQPRYADAGITRPFVQDCHSRSRKGVLRGMHLQILHAQAKLCRVVAGAVQDVVVDVRRDSPCFGRWVAVELSAENFRQIYVPRGFLHGYLALTDHVEFLYKCDNLYTPGDECGVCWNDPTISIAWRLGADPILSAKDAALPSLADLPRDRFPSVAETK